MYRMVCYVLCSKIVRPEWWIACGWSANIANIMWFYHHSVHPMSQIKYIENSINSKYICWSAIAHTAQWSIHVTRMSICNMQSMWNLIKLDWNSILFNNIIYSIVSSIVCTCKVYKMCNYSIGFVCSPSM